MKLQIIQTLITIPEYLINDAESIIVLISDGVYCYTQLVACKNFYIIKDDLNARNTKHNIPEQHLISYNELVNLSLQYNSITW